MNTNTKRQQIDKLVDLTRQELLELGYKKQEIDVMVTFMTRILIFLYTLIGSDTIHKHTAQTLRSLANLIDVMAEKNEK